LGISLALDPDTLWVRTLDRGFDDLGAGVAARGNTVAAVGYSVDDSSNEDWLVARFSPDGDTFWTRTYDGGSNEDAVGVCVDAGGNIVVAGRGYSYSPTSGLSRPWLRETGRTRFAFERANLDFATTAKYDSLGERKWIRTDTGFSATGITVDAAGSYYVCGGKIINEMQWDAWLAKLNSAGDTVWTRTYDFAMLDAAYGAAVDDSGGIAMCVYSGDTLGFDCLTVKLAPNGNVMWTSRYDSTPDDEGTSVAIDRNRNVLVAGRVIKERTYHALVLKYDSAGTLVWDRQYQGGIAGGVDCDSACNIFVAGSVGGGISSNCFTIKLDPTGSLLWQTTFGGPEYDVAGDVVCDADGDPIVVGSMEDTLAFGLDLLLMKYSGLTGIAEPRSAGASRRVRQTTITAAPEFVLAVTLAGRYDVKLCDLNGRVRQQLFAGSLSSGAHRLSLRGQPAGRYVVRATGPDGTTSCQRLTVVK
jgi:hypothetical protein